MTMTRTRRIMRASAAKDAFSKLVSGARHFGDRTIVTVRGKPAAAVVPIEDLLRIEALEKREQPDAGKE